MRAPGWPVTLSSGRLTLRPVRRGDAAAWRRARLPSRDWLEPWEAVPPALALVPWEQRQHVGAWRETVRVTRKQARAGAALPLVIEWDRTFVGQVAVNGIVRGASSSGHLGYWLVESAAGQGIGRLAVGLVVGHAFGSLGLHRLEAYVREENVRSRSLLARLGFRVEGTAVRSLFVAGDWRDHVVYALTREDKPPAHFATRP